MDNKVEICNPGMAISEIILVDGYSLMLRCDKIRRRINEKLTELELDNVQVLVIVDELDKLQLSISLNNFNSRENIPITEGIDDGEVNPDGEKTKKEKFIDSINNVLFSNKYQLKMKQSKEPATVVARDGQEIIAQNLAKAINLSSSEVMLSLEKCGVFNLAETCRKMTNGSIENVFVDDGVYTFINNNGIRLTYNSTAHPEEDIENAITNCILTMIDLSHVVIPLAKASDTSVPVERAPVQYTESTKEQKVAYNKEVKKAVDAIGKELDGQNRRAWSQRLRGILLKCAHRANFEKLSKARMEDHVAQMSSDNKERIRDLYHIYDQVLPEWFATPSVKKVQTKRTKAAKG